MQAELLQYLSKREKQIMDVIYELEAATAKEVLKRIPDPPTRDAVRTLLRGLEAKNLLAHKVEGPRHIYFPVVKKEEARQGLMEHLVKTYFEGSLPLALAALVNTAEQGQLSEAERADLMDIILEDEKGGAE